ncbi:HlyD family secretion protein [Herbaspirillum frisingense]|uniref:hypothetical protein n=1 Tax=Herbaspirillum frisingense TaxID=92645 RepID=UPI001F1E4C03|nr:hypothetical protein [Herbaspirillum frisingense]UIN23519.1 hypothetical protein LAZ82_10655 [Herbaspirillum frisingense]
MEKISERNGVKPLFSLGAETLAAISKLRQALDMRQRIDKAISETQVVTAQAEYDEAMRDQAEAEAGLVLIETREQAADAEKIVAAATRKVEKKLQALEREKRLLEALYVKAKQADDEIQAARGALTAEASILAENICVDFAGRLTVLMEDIVALLKQVYAAQSVVRSQSLGRVLSEFKIPDPQDASGMYALLDGGTARVGNAHVPLAGAWRDDPDSTAVAEALAPLSEARAEGEAHKSFVHPDQRPNLYVIKGYSTNGKSK